MGNIQPQGEPKGVAVNGSLQICLQAARNYFVKWVYGVMV